MHNFVNNHMKMDLSLYKPFFHNCRKHSSFIDILKTCFATIVLLPLRLLSIFCLLCIGYFFAVITWTKDGNVIGWVIFL